MPRAARAPNISWNCRLSEPALERRLTYYRADGSASNGVPNYQELPADELARLVRLYPADRVKSQPNFFKATGEFAGALPGDVGGAGSYTNIATSLGNAGFYLERFRGEDDLAAKTARRLQATDQVTDLILGWSRAELGREPHYQDLRKFLDIQFRQDLKNLGYYIPPNWQGDYSATAGMSVEKARAANEKAESTAMFRFGQYLVEHGYLRFGDLPEVFRAFSENDDQNVARLIQRLVARKLGVPDSQSIPKSLAFLADPDAIDASWEKYLVTTSVFREKIREWEKARKSQPQALSAESFGGFNGGI